MIAYDLVLVGSGFSSLFFLHRALSTGKVRSAIVLERGGDNSWAWQVENGRNTPAEDDYERHIVHAGMPEKRWPCNIGLGGGSNCWWANIMRFHPFDFDLRSRYGVGIDWPIGYDDLERHYCDAEDIIGVSGDPESAVMFPRSRPFPQPRHRFSAVARRFKQAYPDSFFAMPQARARVPTATRNACCSNSMCRLCPVNAKFMIVNDMRPTLDDPRVTVRTRHHVTELVVEGGRVVGVRGRSRSGPFKVRGETVVLGANGIFNPHLLLRSGIDDGPVGIGLHEQFSLFITVLLDGLDDGDGSAHISGAGFGETHGAFRREASGGFYELWNLAFLRPHPTRYRQQVQMVFLFDDLRGERNRVSPAPASPDKPVAHFEGFSDYARRGAQRIIDRLPQLLAHLPVEDVLIDDYTPANHKHLQGTAVMGRDPRTSVVDPGLVHHRHRNLLALGSGAFPTSGWANPTLTICATALRAAELYYGA